ncbi:MAG: A24 family peptidase [Dehalococcoidia bacterium]
MRGSEPIEGALVAAFGSIFMALAWSDLERRVIPNRLVYPALALALAVSGLWPDRGLTDALAGGVSAFVASAAIRCLGGGGLGGGDVKMAALVGTVVGGETIMLAGIATVFAGGLAAAATLADPQGRGTTSLAYGPFIAFGAVVALLA